jgi:hypothetical protein
MIGVSRQVLYNHVQKGVIPQRVVALHGNWMKYNRAALAEWNSKWLAEKPWRENSRQRNTKSLWEEINRLRAENAQLQSKVKLLEVTHD